MNERRQKVTAELAPELYSAVLKFALTKDMSMAYAVEYLLTLGLEASYPHLVPQKITEKGS